ncbi:ribonuclease H-like domain-containing protein [Tanacetum coccineum]
MSVHNSEHNSPINSDHDDDVHDHVTRISKLDISDPLHLHPNDTTALTVVSIKLKGTENYQYDAMIELPKCVCNASEGFKKHNQLLKLMQFLMGLDDSYMQIRSSILSRETLLDVRSAYATIFSEESHRVTVGSITGSSQRNQASAFVSNARYPADFRKKKSGQNFKKQSVSNNNSVGKSSSSGFTDEQMATLISLIKGNKVGKNVQANMAGTNQHMTYTDKELDDVLDISNLNIKVGHSNGTEAYISKIRNLKLSNGLTLLGHPADPVLNVLKDSLNIDKKDNTVCCEICQRAKQTREPFLLSDHTSNRLGDLVHLDLWGPYKVTSSEGFRFFLTIVDDYTRAVWVYLIKSKDEISNDERVANDLNKDKSDSSCSSVFGSNINTADFPVDSRNDSDSSDDLDAT